MNWALVRRGSALPAGKGERDTPKEQHVAEWELKEGRGGMEMGAGPSSQGRGNRGREAGQRPLAPAYLAYRPSGLHQPPLG